MPSSPSFRSSNQLALAASLGVALASASLGSASLAATAKPNPKVRLKTALGEIVVEVDPSRAPVTANNFLRYVDEKRFAGAYFYRVVRLDNQPTSAVKIEVVQGGLGEKAEERGLPPIAHETTAKTGIRHQDGAISMARSKPGSASSEFFICVGDQPELDFGGQRNPDGQGFAAFGRVVSGMDVVRTIQRQPDDRQYLKNVIPIVEVVRIEEGR